jgi:hypothetical protein
MPQALTEMHKVHNTVTSTCCQIIAIVLLSSCFSVHGKSDELQLIPPGTPSAIDIVKPASGVASDVAAPTTPTVPVFTLKQEIAQLEKSGQIVPLDRSDSLLGPDLNNNGVRDAYITSLNLTPAQAKAAFQDARAMQMTLAVDITDKAALQRVGEIGMASAKCFVRIFNGSPEKNIISQALESKTANTKIRVMRYLAYNAARSGSVTTLPSGDTCEK